LKAEKNGCYGILFEKARKTKELQNISFGKRDNHAIYLHPSEIKIIDQKVNYIHQNPVLEGIIDNEEEYVYSSARDYVDKKGLVYIDFL
jgi:hypothetical protein